MRTIRGSVSSCRKGWQCGSGQCMNDPVSPLPNSPWRAATSPLSFAVVRTILSEHASTACGRSAAPQTDSQPAAFFQSGGVRRRASLAGKDLAYRVQSREQLPRYDVRDHDKPLRLEVIALGRAQPVQPWRSLEHRWQCRRGRRGPDTPDEGVPGREASTGTREVGGNPSESAVAPVHPRAAKPPLQLSRAPADRRRAGAATPRAGAQRS